MPHGGSLPRLLYHLRPVRALLPWLCGPHAAPAHCLTATGDADLKVTTALSVIRNSMILADLKVTETVFMIGDLKVTATVY